MFLDITSYFSIFYIKKVKKVDIISLNLCFSVLNNTKTNFVPGNYIIFLKCIYCNI